MLLRAHHHPQDANPQDVMGQCRQAVERQAVDFSKATMRQEALDFRRELEQSCRTDPFHSDLLILHNSAVRQQTAKQRPQSAPHVFAGGAERTMTPASAAAGGGAVSSNRPVSAKQPSSSPAASVRVPGASKRLLNVAKTAAGAEAATPQPAQTSSVLSPTKTSRGSAGADTTDTEQVKGLCTALRNDIEGHCRRMEVDANVFKDPSFIWRLKMKNFGKLKNFMRLKNRSKTRPIYHPHIDNTMIETLAGRFQKVELNPWEKVGDFNDGLEAEEEKKGEVPDDMALSNLASFLADLDTPLRTILQTLDKNNTGQLRVGDWQHGLSKLGFQGNCMQTFRLLDSAGHRVLSLQEVEVKLKRLDDRLLRRTVAVRHISERTV